MKNNQLLVAVIAAVLLIVGAYYFGSKPNESPISLTVDKAIAAKFETLSNTGNSSCSLGFMQSIDNMSNDESLRGSCCSPMNLHRYEEQVTGLEKYKDIPEIPKDPYEINVKLAKELKVYYDVELTPEQQQAYDYAMANSNEKGPCCCKCWRWYVYGGLAKLLIQKYQFTGEQVTEVWNLSDGCGGAGDHVNH